MNFDARYLHDRLLEFEAIADKPRRYLVAFSGGIDSTVLLHALATGKTMPGTPLLAVHVDHGLHPDSGDWDARCRRVAGDLGVEYISRRIEVSHKSPGGPEAAAREARYAMLGSLMLEQDWLISAHHEQDQAETLLLNLLRGSGLTGISGISPIREFARGHLVRPMLGVPASAIRAYADQHRLGWIDDPSNSDTAFDRNYLRREVMPLLATRWPAAATRLRQSADLAAEASDLLAELADLDLKPSPSPDRLDIGVLACHSAARQRNALRRAVHRLGLPAPPATRLYQAVHELIPARPDAQPLVTWPGGEFRRYRDHLYILAPMPELGSSPADLLRPDRAIELGVGQGSLVLMSSDDGGIKRSVAEEGLQIRYRVGGEEIGLRGQAHRHKLKNLLQDAGIVPW
ncbi:MAG TPA: tRNA lysidine(34) synthetase TilS, partial [Woeseiaceae bacterium]|nr:tRNA lysidine(34) synthetase TilS [Woeseiaceae bacterium]